MHQTKFLAIILMFVLAVGCSSSTSQNSAQPPTETPAADQAAAQPNPTPPAPPPPPPPELATTAQEKPSNKSSASSEPVSPTPRPGMKLEKADVGSGEKGRGYEPGVISTPVATYFKAQERITFYIQIPDYIRAYKFGHDFKGPKSNEEFMEKIIKKNYIRLPTLPPGHSYVYDPKTEQLMVEKPK